MLTRRETHMFLMLAFIVALLIGAFYFLKEEETVVTPPSQEGETVATVVVKERTVTGVVIPDDVHTYVGEVDEIQANYIQVRAQSHNNYLSNDTVLKVNFDESTIFELYTFPRVIPKDTSFPERTVKIIGYSEINTGDMVTVSSEENTRGKSEFYANKIVVNRAL